MRILLLASIFLLGACSFKPEENGLCKLNCGSAIIGGNDSSLSIQLKTATPQTACLIENAGKAVGPFTAYFVISEKFPDGTESGGQRPVPNLSIEPLINGARPNLGNENDADDRYRGVLTPRSNWCSDSCGVVAIQAASVCPPPGEQNSLSIQVHTGALFSNEAVFPITTPEPDN